MADCCLCKKQIFGYGNNALPLKSGVCCDDCNARFVLLARVRRLAEHDKKKRKDVWITGDCDLCSKPQVKVAAYGTHYLCKDCYLKVTSKIN